MANLFANELLRSIIAYCLKGYKLNPWELSEPERKAFCNLISVTTNPLKPFQKGTKLSDEKARQYFDGIKELTEDGFKIKANDVKAVKTEKKEILAFIQRRDEIEVFNFDYEHFVSKYICKETETDKIMMEIENIMLELINKKLVLTDFQTEIYLRFQERYFQIQQNWGIGVNLPDWGPNDEEKRYIELYWYLVFDEWMLSDKNPNIKKLWDQIYKAGVSSSLKFPAFQETINKMFAKGINFRGFGQNFKKELESLGLNS